ncbi:MAG: DUF2851 family protein [Cytophagales bacterium]|nr:DUF2851 family protein [Cytophagales bacterium]
MNEAFLHFIWKFQKFTSELVTSQGERVRIFYQGNHNHDAGPDFLEARIKIGELEWNGQVEIHLMSSDWIHHNHSSDSGYNTVVLHVVWEHDKEISREDGSGIPTVEIKNLVDLNLVTEYKSYLAQPNDILCQAHLPSISDLTWISNLDRMLSKRLEDKSQRNLSLAKILNDDWEETAYRVLGRNFGFSLNSETFQQITEILPLKFLSKHSSSHEQIEALIFGVGGFLEEPLDDYQEMLKTEFVFLKKKYDLKDNLHRTHWRFGKMRPSNFPSVRLAQFSAILHAHQKLFSLFCEVSSIKELKNKLTVTPSPYWHEHYDFGKKLKKGSNALGKSSFENLTINSVAPLLAAYSIYTDQQSLMDKAINLLESLPAESNRHTAKWTNLNRPAKSAFDSQGQITLYQDFCSKKNCLNCGIGSWIFNK